MFTNAQAALMAAVQYPNAYRKVTDVADEYLVWLNAQDTPQAAQPLTPAPTFDWHTAQVTLDNSAKINDAQRRQFNRLIQQGKLSQAQQFYNGVMSIEQATPVSEGAGNMRVYMAQAEHITTEDRELFMAHLNAGRTTHAVAMYRTAMSQDPHNG